MDNDQTEAYPRGYIKMPFSDTNSFSIPVRIMQWNILAQGFIPLDEFIHIRKNQLSLTNRSHQIAGEILRFQPDFACLQEVDILTEIQSCLTHKELSYKSQFLPKTLSPCTLIENNHGPDGSVILYRSDRYDLVQTIQVPLDNEGNRKALHCIFRPQNSNPIEVHLICLHLKAKVNYAEARRHQGLQLCTYLHQLIDAFPEKLHPIFVCGDFNAEPHEPVIALLKQFPTSNKFHAGFSSAYAVANADQEPEFTTWKFRQSERIGTKSEEKHTIDYIWYSKQLSCLTGIWSIPEKDVIGPKGLPSPCFPSDHMNLVADFLIP